MSDIKLFEIKDTVEELPATYASLEGELQILIEENMPMFLELFFLKASI